MKSAITSDIQAVDHVRDLTFRGMADAAKSALNHFNSEKNADFIRKWNVVIDKYKNTILQRQGKNAAKTAKTPPAK